jgi:hypothetical protein
MLSASFQRREASPGHFQLALNLPAKTKSESGLGNATSRI